MITLHKAESTTFTSLGLGVISDMVGGVVVEELNGAFELTMKYPTTGIRYKDFQLRRIIYAKPNPYAKPQPFRIYSISKPINRVVTINACHISYDLTGYPVNEFKGTSPSDTMSKLKSNAQVPHNFTFNSTVTTTGEVNVEGPRTTRSVLGNNILSAYGGEYEFDNFMVYHYESRGMNRGVTVRYGKNMTDINQEENISNVYTGVYPYWEGTELETNKKVMVKLPEKVINAPGTYNFTRILPLDLSQEFMEKPTEEKLREKANKYIEDNKIGTPKVSLTMSFIQLSKSTENANFKVLDQVELGDTISVYFEELGIDATARCVKTTYNLCTDRYDSVELGDAKSNLSVAISDSKKETVEAIEKQKVFFDAEIGNIKIDIAHIDQAIIDKADINWVSANYAHLVNGYIDTAQIKDASIGTAQIGDAEITVAKIQDAFIDSLTAAQGKFQSAHIGVLTSDNIDANTITAEYIKAVVIDAINLNVSGKISADRIEAIKMEVEQLDAGKITTGTLDADRIGANTIDVSKLTISDMTNLATLYQDTTDPNKVYEIKGRDNKLCQGYIPISDHEDTLELVYDLYCKTLDDTTSIRLSAMAFVTYSDGTTGYPYVVISQPESARDWVKKTVTLKIIFEKGKTPIAFLPILQIPESPTDNKKDNWQVKQVIVRRKNSGKLIVDGSIDAKHLRAGSITTEKLDANAITAELITSSVVRAINMSAAKIDAKNINTENLSVNGSLIAGDIAAETIKTNVISAINSYAGTMKIKQGQIESLKVGNANIVDLDASKIKTGKIDADRIDVNKIVIKEANITGTITASKISGGTLDASKMTVTNLKADSITTGSITVLGENLIHNTNFENNFVNWTPDTSVGLGSIDKVNKFEGVNSIRLNITTGNGLLSEAIPAAEGSTFVASIYTKTKTLNAPHTIAMMILFENSSGAFISQHDYTVTKSLPNNQDWTRHIISFTAPAGTVKVRYKFRSNGYFDGWFAKPMLSRGTIASEWKLHNDELISNGAIDTDKIANEAVGVSKLNLQDLFVSESGFIKKLNAVDIAANQITIGKITGEQIDISGLVTFEALDTTLQPLFDVTGNKTYINGGMIATNSIKANSIDLLSGLTVFGPDNTVSFSVASNGSVTVNALLRSGNFDDEKKTGYQISPDGKAILNQATIRGNVILPNSGITNDYDMSQEVERNYFYNSKGPYERNSFAGLPNTSILLSKIAIPSSAKSGDSFTLSFEVTYTNVIPKSPLASEEKVRTTIQGYGDITDWSDGGFIGIPFELQYSNPKTIKEKVVLYGNFKQTHFKNNFWYMSIRTDYIQSGTISISNLKFELSQNENPTWTPAPEDNLNPVRIWAGTSYEQKENAPFRVMQNGDVYAYNANLTGVLYGEVDSGFVNIKEKELSIVDDTTTTSVEYVKMSPDRVFVNTDFILGTVNDKKLIYSNKNKTIDIDGTTTRIINRGVTVSFEDTTSWTSSVKISSNLTGDDNSLSFGYSTGTWKNTMIITSDGSKGGTHGDVTLRRRDWNEDIDFYVEGNIRVRKSISSTKQNIEIRSVQSEGWGFYAT